MWTYGVVKSLDVSKEVSRSCRPVRIMPQMRQFTLETAEKVFRHSVVIGVAFSGHALPKAQLRQALPVLPGRILYSAVAVEDKSLSGPLPMYSHVQRRQGQRRIASGRESVTNNFACTEVFYNSQIQPALAGGDICYVAHPGLIRAFKIEVPVQQVWGNWAGMAGICGTAVRFFALRVNISLISSLNFFQALVE